MTLAPARPDTVVPVATERHRVRVADPFAAYLALRRRFGAEQVYLLESPAGPAGDTRHAYVGFGELLSVSVTGREVTVTGRPALAEAARRRAAGVDRLEEVLRVVHELFDAPGDPGDFSFGFLAFLGYDAARHFERLPYLIERGPRLPHACLVLHRGLVRFDLVTGTAELLLHRSPLWPDDPADALVALLDAAAPERSGDAAPAGAGDPSAAEVPMPPFVVDDDVAEADYHRTVDRCLGHIAAGDIYQVQIGHELTIRSDADPVRVYERLRRRNPSPYMYLAPLAGQTVIGASPELFVRVEDGTATMRPIAGTAPRVGDPARDRAVGERLSTDPKEIAEHVMLVDLCRNDIGRICRPDTLDVPETLVVERYSHVLHLVSTVSGEVSPELDTYDVLAAVFPAGTMTGAPKIRAMEIIESMEASRRGLYAGAIGLIGTGGHVNLALCIRTVLHDGESYHTRASAGVVADSRPEREWRETLAKLSAGYWAVTGEELL
ncbi:anthranilate synthase component I family protein [Micromonospora sp. NBC_01412]|uniref:anthranilate synthase component I family protein n=1 Tax=Micromonospora sp. NBC_01412 TaxID=2903590 RepID=UPI0032499CA4